MAYATDMKPQLPSWITPEGIDLKRVPLESFIGQALSDDLAQFASACRLLGAIAHHGRNDAGIFLLGLLSHHRDDLRRLEHVAEALGAFPSASAAAVLFDELRRVKGSNSTRGYLNCVVNALQRFPADLICEGFRELAADRSQSYRMRQRFEQIFWSLPAPSNPPWPNKPLEPTA